MIGLQQYPPFDFYLLPFNFYLLLFTFYLLPFYFCFISKINLLVIFSAKTNQCGMTTVIADRVFISLGDGDTGGGGCQCYDSSKY